jgi:hypothetical protein
MVTSYRASNVMTSTIDVQKAKCVHNTLHYTTPIIHVDQDLSRLHESDRGRGKESPAAPLADQTTNPDLNPGVSKHAQCADSDAAARGARTSF